MIKYITDEEKRLLRGSNGSNGSKKPLCAYLFFTKEERKKAEYRELNPVKMVRSMANKWHDMTPEEKEPYNILAEEDKVKYLDENKERIQSLDTYQRKLEQKCMERYNEVCRKGRETNIKSYYRVYDKGNPDDDEEATDLLITDDIWEVINLLQYEAEKQQKIEEEEEGEIFDNDDNIIKNLLDTRYCFISVAEYKNGISKELGFESIFRKYLSTLILTRQQERLKCSV
jgi:hypothetical protein